MFESGIVEYPLYFIGKIKFMTFIRGQVASNYNVEVYCIDSQWNANTCVHVLYSKQFMVGYVYIFMEYIHGICPEVVVLWHSFCCLPGTCFDTASAGTCFDTASAAYLVHESSVYSKQY